MTAYPSMTLIESVWHRLHDNKLRCESELLIAEFIGIGITKQLTIMERFQMLMIAIWRHLP